jgi:hypothetical protein
MGERPKQPLRVRFNRQVKLEFLGNFLRRLGLPRKTQAWTLTTFQVKLIKIGAKVVRHARSLTFQLTEVAVPRVLFETIMQKIYRFAVGAREGGRIGNTDS